MAEITSMSSESSFGSFFSSDWYSPMEFFRSISGLGSNDSPTGDQSHIGPSPCDLPSPSCCVTRPGEKPVLVEQAETTDVMLAERIDVESVKMDNEHVLLESVVSELREEEEFLQYLLEGPPSTKVSEEGALRYKVKQTLLDGAVSGCLLMALSELEQPRTIPQEDCQDGSMANIGKLRQKVYRSLCDGAATGKLETALSKVELARKAPDVSAAAWDQLGQSLATASELLELRDKCSFIVIESEAVVEQPKPTPDIEALWHTLCEPETQEQESSEEATSDSDVLSERAATTLLEVAPSIRSKAEDALTKSKRPEVSDDEQLYLQAKTALLDVTTYGCLHAKVTSPRKGKKMASPKKGGS